MDDLLPQENVEGTPCTEVAELPLMGLGEGDQRLRPIAYVDCGSTETQVRIISLSCVPSHRLASLRVPRPHVSLQSASRNAALSVQNVRERRRTHQRSAFTPSSRAGLVQPGWVPASTDKMAACPSWVGSPKCGQWRP